LSIKIDKEELTELTYSSTERFKHVSCEITGESRWDLFKSLIFKDKETGKFYGYEYSEGATENQDYSSFDDEPDEITCKEMVAVEVMKIEYQYLKEDE
jgi:hypothetical protein